MTPLPRHTARLVFLAFASAYFLSALTRAITATLSPTLTQEFALSASDLGLLAGGFFLGFATTQLPLGQWLDSRGPKTVVLGFLSVAVLGCIAFALARSFAALWAARILCGVGLSACLMAPLTGYRRWFDLSQQMRANSWMLMAGALGMVTSTLPVQWLTPILGWRGLFGVLAALMLLAMGLIAWKVPAWQPVPSAAGGTTSGPLSYRAVWAHPYFRRMAPLGFFCYGGYVAMQTLWAAPWMVKVAGYSPQQAAEGLFAINVAMLCSFWAWGMVNPWLTRRGLHPDQLIARGLPLSFVLLAWMVFQGGQIEGSAAGWWALYCVSCTVVALAQPAVGMAFAPALAGRALSAYNLVIFAGVFVIQWGIGLAIDGFKAAGWPEIPAFQCAMCLFLLCSMASYGYFLAAKKP